MESKEIFIAPITDAIIPSGVVDRPSVCGAFILNTMKLIPLSQGKFAQVDDEDFEYLKQFKWNAHKSGKTFYAERYAPINGKQYYIKMHREIMQTPKGKEVDHKDHNGLNCQRSNMRNCTHGQNMINQRSRGKSQYRGVVWNTKNNAWLACMGNGGKHRLGFFNDEILAAITYDKAAKEKYGEFANLNFK